MASKKKPKAPAPAKPQRENLAARPASFDEPAEEQLVDHSGVFRVTSAIAQAQTGHGDDNNPRFASDSLVMAAQRASFPDDGPTIDELADDNLVDDEAGAAAKRERLATLAARHRAQQSTTRRR